MRTTTILMILIFLGRAANAQEPCAEQKALIDQRLAQPGYTQQQIGQGEQLKQQIDLMCGMGGPQAANMLIMQLDRILPPPTAGDVAMSKLSKDDLTNEYLRGEWCRDGQEATSYDFLEDGTYKYAVVGFGVGPDGHRYFPDVRAKKDFLDEFDHLRSKGDDEFVMSIEQRGQQIEYRFVRGRCAFMSVGGAG